MNKLILAAALAAATSVAALTSFANAAVTPCEDMLKELRKTMETAKLNDADMKAVKDLEDKGIERCNADDDKRADTFFTDALKLAGKK